MKHSLSLLALSLAMTVAAHAQEANGQFNRSFTGGVAQTNVEAFCRAQLPRMSEGTSFEVSRDVTDKYGTRHITLQQYVDGLKADGCQVLVHMRDGKIQSINGNVITQQMMPEPAARKAAIREEAKGKEVVLYVKDGVAHQAYKMVKGGKRLIIDAQTGEVLSRTPLRRQWDGPTGESVKAKGFTIFNGEQEFNATLLEDGSYTLIDSERQIYTLDASFQAMRQNGMSIEEIDALEPESIEFASEEDYQDYVTQSALTQIAHSSLYMNDKPEWMDLENRAIIDSIRFTVVDLENSPIANMHLYGQYLDEDANVVITTDTILIDKQETMFHLPHTLQMNNEPLSFQLCIDPSDAGTEENVYVVLPPLFSYNALEMPISTITEPEDEEEYKQMMKEQLTMGKITFLNQMEGTAALSDIQWGMSKVLDYYKNTFEYNSFDNMGTEVYCLVNAPESNNSFANACALTLPEGLPGVMYFGMGGYAMDKMLAPFVILPVMGHEFTHLVARNLEGTADNMECASNALNESFADIMGFAINRYATGNISWKVGEELGLVVRRFDIPEDCNMDPSCFLDDNYDTETFEEHTNACVQDHMFYLLCTGGEGVNSLGQDYAVTPMDMYEAEALAFNTLINYTVMVMSYPAISKAWIAAATDMFGAESSQVLSVRQAWAAVGLSDGIFEAIQQIGNDTQRQSRRYNLQGQPTEGAQGFVIESGRVSACF